MGIQRHSKVGVSFIHLNILLYIISLQSRWPAQPESTASTSPRRTSSGSSRRPHPTGRVMLTANYTKPFLRCSLMLTPTSMVLSVVSPSPSLWTRLPPFPEPTDTLLQTPSSTNLMRREMPPGRRCSTPWISRAPGVHQEGFRHQEPREFGALLVPGGNFH